jgi:hypothetical protein
MLKALSGSVVVSRGDLETERGLQRAPGSLLFYGREVDVPWGHVVASGDDELPVGSVVVMQADLGRTAAFEGMKVQVAHTSRKVGFEKTAKRDVLAVRQAAPADPEWPYVAPKGRRVMRLVDLAPASEVIQMVAERDGFDRGDDEDGRRWLFEPAKGSRFDDELGTWVSVKVEHLQAEQLEEDLEVAPV